MADLFDEKNISPMLLNEVKEPFDDDDYIYELKLDGIRCVAYIEPKLVTLQNKRFKDLTDIYPELSDMCKCVKKRVILDLSARRFLCPLSSALSLLALFDGTHPYNLQG